MLGGLCAVQWRQAYGTSVQIAAWQRSASEQGVKLADQSATIRLQQGDAAAFKDQIARLEEAVRQSEAALRTNMALASQFEADRERSARQSTEWQKALDAYKTALSSRDDAIKKLEEQRETLIQREKDTAARANEAVLAYNQLAEKYKSAVDKYNKLAAEAQARNKPQ